MSMRFSAIPPAVAFALMFVLVVEVVAQSRAGIPPQDIVERLLPHGGIPKEILVKPKQRYRIIKQLKAAQGAAQPQRRQQVAFLLATLGENYDHNRDYLFKVLSGCNYREIRYGCDDMTGFYLIYLREHGHKEILAPLLKASISSYNAAGSEGLGDYFGQLVQNSPEEFLEAVSTFDVGTQKKACSFAGSSDGGGLGTKGLAKVRRKLRGIGSEIAIRCLNEIEDSNKPD